YGRCESQVNRRKRAPKSGEVATVPTLGSAAMKEEPTTQVDDGRDDQRAQEPGVERPGAQAGVKRWAHGYSLSSVRVLAGWAGSAPAGRRFSRKSTSAVISAGLTWLPYAGILPPPGVPLLI